MFNSKWSVGSFIYLKVKLITLNNNEFRNSQTY